MTTLTGWGRTAPSAAEVVVRSSRHIESLRAAVKDLPRRGGIVRGMGRSYGDPAQNGGGTVLRLQDHAHDTVLDTVAATATVPAGVSLDELLQVLVPRGFFVPVSRGPASSPSAGPSPATSTARTTTSTDRSGPT